ncbi:unnamed protein product [Microthlaspi erraticum]|uniref:Uncharacterized protein n=1 Tax=Microthlaspi erraticum TaxID=1685480 RepID=A0A6D2J8S0_9BRAS|nr:unnamed protein product [Microthlaspi erraticum]
MKRICEKRSLKLDRAEDRAEDNAQGLDFSKGSTSGKGKPWKDAKVHGQDGEQDQEFGEERFLVLQARRRSPRLPHSLGVDHSSPLQGGSLPKSLTEPLISSQGKEKTTRREGGRVPKIDAPTRSSPNRGNSTRSS